MHLRSPGSYNFFVSATLLTSYKINLLATTTTPMHKSREHQSIASRAFSFGSNWRFAVVSQTVIDGLRPYNIGDKIRGLRLRKKMGLVELGQHTGLSAALLSKLERGKL